ASRGVGVLDTRVRLCAAAPPRGALGDRRRRGRRPAGPAGHRAALLPRGGGTGVLAAVRRPPRLGRAAGRDAADPHRPRGGRQLPGGASRATPFLPSSARIPRTTPPFTEEVPMKRMLSCLLFALPLVTAAQSTAPQAPPPGPAVQPTRPAIAVTRV